MKNYLKRLSFVRDEKKSNVTFVMHPKSFGEGCFYFVREILWDLPAQKPFLKKYSSLKL